MLPFTGRVEDLNASAKWVHDQAGAILSELDGLPVGVVQLILRRASERLESAISAAATDSIFRPEIPESTSEQASPSFQAGVFWVPL